MHLWECLQLHDCISDIRAAIVPVKHDVKQMGGASCVGEEIVIVSNAALDFPGWLIVACWACRCLTRAELIIDWVAWVAHVIFSDHEPRSACDCRVGRGHLPNTFVACSLDLHPHLYINRVSFVIGVHIEWTLFKHSSVWVALFLSLLEIICHHCTTDFTHQDRPPFLQMIGDDSFLHKGQNQGRVFTWEMDDNHQSL